MRHAIWSTAASTFTSVRASASGWMPGRIAYAAGVNATTGLTLSGVAEPGMTWTCGFSPGGTSLRVVLTAIDAVSPRPGRQATILVATYAFTSLDVARALVRAKDRGVRVAVVADPRENQSRYSKVRYLANHGIEVRFDHRLAMVHDKFMVLDGTAVETGSFNYSRAAASNEHAENACVFQRAPKMAQRFTQHWKRLWEQSVQGD